jgi:hypothetical protein
MKKGDFIEVPVGSGRQVWLAPSFTQPQWNDPDHQQFFQIEPQRKELRQISRCCNNVKAEGLQPLGFGRLHHRHADQGAL